MKDRDYPKIKEFVKQLCKEQDIPISKIEKDLGFGNGYLAKVGKIDQDRLEQIANYLGVSVEYLESCGKDGLSGAYIKVDFNTLVKTNPKINDLFSLVLSEGEGGIQRAIDAMEQYRKMRNDVEIELHNRFQTSPLQADQLPKLDNDDPEGEYKKHLDSASSMDSTALSGTEDIEKVG